MKWIYIVLIVAALAFGVRQFGKRMWESTLWGHYVCQSFDQEPVGEPMSALVLGTRAVLHVSEYGTNGNSVLRCISSNGHLLSSTLLTPQRTNTQGRTDSAWLRNAKLLREYRPAKGRMGRPAVLFECQWEWGGSERGVLVLNDDCSFKEVWLSW